MSSSSRKPFQDETNGQSEDPKEKKRERERYAKNKDEILKRRHQLRQLKKTVNDPVNEENTLCDTQATGQSGVTQVQYMDTEEGMAPDVQRYESQTHLGSNSMVGGEPDWLHRRDAYQMQAKPGGMMPNFITKNSFLAAGSLTPLTAVDDIVACNKVSLEKQQTGHGWYARLSVVKKTEYLQRLRIARQQKKAAAMSDVEVSQTSAAPLPNSPWICDYASPMDPQTPVSESAMEHVSTSAYIHGQQSFLAKSADSEKRRQHRREMYSLMTDEQKELCLRNNREYKRCRRETRTFFDHDYNVAATGGSTVTPRSTSAMQAQSSSKNNRTGPRGDPSGGEGACLHCPDVSLPLVLQEELMRRQQSWDLPTRFHATKFSCIGTGIELLHSVGISFPLVLALQ